MDVNVYGPYRLIRAALPGFRGRKSGMIINISSVSGIDGSIASGLYATSKFAIEGQHSIMSFHRYHSTDQGHDFEQVFPKRSPRS